MGRTLDEIGELFCVHTLFNFVLRVTFLDDFPKSKMLAEFANISIKHMQKYILYDRYFIALQIFCTAS